MVGFRAIGKRQDCELLETRKRPVATAGAPRRLGRLARSGPLAAKVPGIVAALLIALIAACTNEMHFTPSPIPKVTQAVLAIPATPTPAPFKAAAAAPVATPTATLPATAPPRPPAPVLPQEPTATPIPTATLTPTAPPPPAANLTPLAQIAVGDKVQCGLQGDGRVTCRGGEGSPWWHPPAADPYRQITVGPDYACGLRRDGTIACWGASNKERDVPPPGQFTLVSAGDRHACALDTAGYAHCWGRDDNGQATPPAGLAFTTIAAGGSHSCGLTANGALRCWGKNDLGQADFHSGPFQSLALGIGNTCALRPDGTAWCQGDNAAGQSNPPPGAFTHLAAGSDYACGLRPGGRLECWGGGFGAELGEPAGKFKTVSADGNTFCALTPAGFPVCWRYWPGDPQSFVQPVEIALLAVSREMLRWPLELFPWPGGGLALVEREGLIRLCSGGVPYQCAGTDNPPLLDLTDQVDFTALESGMLSAALDPDFDRFPFLYVWYTDTADPRKARLSRFPVVDGRVDRAGELVILELPMPKDEHFGGAARFGPDGMLYLGIGDNGFPAAAQSLESWRGKIIRIDVRGASPEQPYRVPADNPFQDTEGARPEIWAYGLRNPWRMSFDDDGRLWVGDVGATTAGEISIATAGANLGWPVFEGHRCQSAEGPCAALPEYVPPALLFGRGEGCALIWGGPYRGAALPAWAGAQLAGDYCSGRVWALTPDEAGGWQKRLAATVSSPLLSFGTDAAGEMYALSLNRPLLKLTPVFAAGPAAENPAAGP